MNQVYRLSIRAIALRYFSIRAKSRSVGSDMRAAIVAQIRPFDSQPYRMGGRALDVPDSTRLRAW
jgi:hypothetical protein